MKHLAIAAFGIATAVVAYQLGDSYIGRLPDHRGFYLIAVEDHLAKPLEPRPRHTVVVLFDGLRRDFATRMKSLDPLRAKGRCAVTDVGAPTVSRPVYAVLSTGLEQDRTGSRNNAEESPLAAESIWEVARRSGLEVTATSGVPWWKQLFPNGFTSYRVAEEPEDFFTTTELRDLTLIHPDYVDHAGHSFGAASPEYARAAERADRELGELIARMDLDQDLLVVTADHGHSARGGHGGPTPEIREVLTCLAGRGVAHGPEARITMRILGPAIALLIGVPFPRHMRAGEDELDLIFDLGAALPAEHLTERKQAVLHFRRENQDQIGSWSEHYRSERMLQLARALPVLVLIGFIFAKRGKARAVAYTLLVALATGVVHVWVRGTFDFTAINQRADYVSTGFTMCIGVLLAAALVHAAAVRSVRELLADELALTAVGLVVMLGHVFVFGWPLGFPLPPPALFLLPFIGSIFLATHALFTALLAPIAAVRARRKEA